MSENISQERFLRRVVDASALSADELREALGEIGDLSETTSAETVSKHLVDTGRLTLFQAETLLGHRAGELRVGQYLLLDRLGAGGMGTVFKARHQRMNRVVALKMLTGDAARQPAFIRRFEREVQTIAQLGHPNIVMAYDAGECSAGPFLVMEFVNGHDLGTEVEQGGPLSVAGAVESILQAAAGLAYAHGQGLVHRDIKPANLLRDASGAIKVADLGLARFSDVDLSGNSLTQVGGFVGSAAYAPPEQALDATTVDHRADIYSLGCTLFFLLTGRALYASRSVMSLLLMHREAPIPSLCDAREDVPAALDQIYRRMVAKVIGDRFATMTEVISTLETLSRQTPLSTVKPGLPPRSARTAGPLDVTVPDGAAAFGEALAAPVPSVFANAPTLPAQRRLGDLTVVLVEPSRVQTNLVRSFLQQLGVDKIHCATSGRQAIDLARREGADVLLSAMHLSDMTGAELAESLASDPGSSAVGFVLTSSEAEVNEANRSPSLPHAHVLQKPYTIEQLAHSLAQASGCVPLNIMPTRS